MLARILIAAVLALASSVEAQTYPSKPIRIIDPFPAGGASDQIARILGEKLFARWGQPVIVENRAGAGGNVGAEAVFKADSDGYTLLSTLPPFVINKRLYTKIAYDPDAFVPVSLIAVMPIVLAVHPKLGAKSVGELISLAKASPGRLNYASQGNGTTAHLTAELFNSMAGVKVVHVPYKGSAPALTDLIAGQVEMMFVPLAASHPHIVSGRIRALAVGTEKRNPSLADVPTMSETLPGFFAAAWFGIVAAPRTPSEIANKLSAAIAEALKLPDVARKITGMGASPAGGTPSEMGQFLRQEAERWGNVIRSAGVKLE